MTCNFLTGLFGILATKSARAGLVVSILGIAGCGATYTSPTINDNDDNVAVTVVQLDAGSVAEANRSKYTPKSLPRNFYQVANGGSFVGLGSLPDAPDIPNGRRTQPEANLPPTIEPEPYRIGVGDVVLLATKGGATTVEQLSGLLAAQNSRQGYTVRDDGVIAIPEIGSVSVAGLTLQEAEDALFDALVDNQIDPSFSLEVAEFNSQRVTVGGAVKSAALVPIGLNTVTLGSALVAAGGLEIRDEEFASIRIYRDGALYQLPVADYLKKSDLRDMPLQNGDAIFVDVSYDLERALEFYRQQIDVIALRGSARGNSLSALNAEMALQRNRLEESRRNFQARVELDAIERDYVYLSGEVNKQSRIVLPFNRQASLADVLYDEGGFDNTTGDPSQIYVLRGTPGSNVVTAYHLDAQNAANFVLATRFQMRPNDVVFIEEQVITKWGRALQQLFPVLISQAVK